MALLPEGVNIPKNNNGKYLKIEEGTTRFRILKEPALVGYVGWQEEGGKRKPIRVKDIEETKGVYVEKGEWKFFAVFPVFHFSDVKNPKDGGEVKLFELTQKSLIASIQENSEMPEFGGLVNHDFQINRTGKGMETKYAITPLPAPKEEYVPIEAFLEAEKIKIEKLFDNGDPFVE